MQPWQDPEIDKLVEEYSELAKLRLDGNAEKRDKEGDFSFDRWRTAAEMGVFSMCMPSPYGQGKSLTHTIAAYEGITKGCRDGGLMFALFNQVVGIQMTLVNMASNELKEKYLPDLISGKSLACYAFTEENSGSDSFSMETTATEDGDGYRLNGVKSYLTNAPFSNLAIVFAKTSANRNPFGLTAFLVDLDWQGCSKGRTFEKAGLRTVHMGEVCFDNVYIPKNHIIGSKGTGVRVLTESTAYERALMTVTALGPMKRALDACVERCKTRKTYDKPIGSYQQISSRIANMIMRYRLCRQVQYDTVSKLDSGIKPSKISDEIAINKLFITENFTQFEMDAMQIFGVRGYLLDNFIQQDLRDSLAGGIWAGTSETLRNTVAKFAGLPVE